MISAAYVKNDICTLYASDPSLLLEETLREISESVDIEVNAYLNQCEMYAIESEIMGSIDESAHLYIESEKSNVFEKIGNAIIEVAKRIAKFIQSIIDKIKNIGFKNKSDEEKLKALLEDTKKNDPEKYKTMSKEVIAEFKNGELDFDSVKSIKEMREAYNEFLEIAKKKGTSPDDLSVKFEQMKKKAENADRSAVVKVAAAGVTLITAALAVATFKSKLDSAKKASIDAQSATAELNEKTLKVINELKNSTNDYEKSLVSENLKKSTIIKNAQLWMNNETKGYVTEELNVVQKISHGITNLFRKQSSQDFLAEVDRQNDKFSRRSDAEKQAEKDKAKDTEAARLDARRRDTIAHEDDDNKREARREVRKRQAVQDMEDGLLLNKNSNRHKAEEEKEKIKVNVRRKDTENNEAKDLARELRRDRAKQASQDTETLRDGSVRQRAIKKEVELRDAQSDVDKIKPEHNTAVGAETKAREMQIAELIGDSSDPQNPGNKAYKQAQIDRAKLAEQGKQLGRPQNNKGGYKNIKKKNNRKP